MNTPPRDVAAHLLRLAACLLMLAAAAVAQHGRILGREMRPGPMAAPMVQAAEPAPRPATWDLQPSQAAILAVLLLAALVPLVTKSRRWRTVQLWLDVAVLGLWTGSFLSTARLVGWAGAGLPLAAADRAIALILLSPAFLYPVFGRASHYCLHVCPFGAAQELASRLPARKWRLGSALMRRLTAFRRALWAALMLAAWCGAWSRWTEWELFGAFAWRAVPPLVVALALAFVALSAFVPRAYCRFVCPTGTLLKLSEANQSTTQPPNHLTMKAANFVNVLLSIALVILCIELHAERKARTQILSGHSVSNCEAGFIQALFAEGDSPTPAPEPASVTIDSTGLAPGVSGFGGPVPVLVEVKDGVVAGVSPKLPNDETPGFFKRLDETGLWKAWDGLPVEVAATARVDAVASATYSSAAAIANVRAALEAAKKAER